jgi:hypothetical protein
MLFRARPFGRAFLLPFFRWDLRSTQVFKARAQRGLPSQDIVTGALERA